MLCKSREERKTEEEPTPSVQACRATRIPSCTRLAPVREELYRQFYVHRRKMGDPTSMRSPEEVFGTKVSGTVRLFFVSSVSCHTVNSKKADWCTWLLQFHCHPEYTSFKFASRSCPIVATVGLRLPGCLAMHGHIFAHQKSAHVREVLTHLSS